MPPNASCVTIPSAIKKDVIATMVLNSEGSATENRANCQCTLHDILEILREQVVEVHLKI